MAIILRIFSIYKLIGSFSKSRSIDQKIEEERKEKFGQASYVQTNASAKFQVLSEIFIYVVFFLSFIMLKNKDIFSWWMGDPITLFTS